MWTTVAEEVKILHDFIECFSQWGVQKGVKESRVIE